MVGLRNHKNQNHKKRGRQKARLLGARDRDAAMRLLQRDPRNNLQLLDLASRLDGSGLLPNDVLPQLVGSWIGGELAGVASLRPSLVLDSWVVDEMLDAWMPFLEAVPSGLIKSRWEAVTSLLERLEKNGRGFLVDRAETAYLVVPEHAKLVGPPDGVRLRAAQLRDLDDLVEAARASLREEGRPDPFDGDPVGFRRWVASRVPRARVVESDGSVLFVGYADVRRKEGWLVQGVYTFTDARRQGLAAAGMSALVREAFANGADHVQLAVVRGNHAATSLYERLGFEPFGELRTLLFI